MSPQLLGVVAAAASEGGLNPFDASAMGGTLWTIVIFVLALIPMWRLVLGPVVNALESRDDVALRRISEAEKASQEAEKARAEVEIKLGEARSESSRILAEARERASVREREIVEAANRKAAEETEAALKQIAAEKDKAIAEIRDTVVDLALGAASKVLERNVGSEDDRRMVESLVGDVKEARG